MTYEEIYTTSSRDTNDTLGSLTSGHLKYVAAKVNDALREICNFMNYSWLKRFSTITLVSETQTYLLSTLTYTIDEDRPCFLYYRGSDNSRHPIDIVDDVEFNQWEDSDNGNPLKARLTNMDGTWKIELNCPPSSSFVGLYSTLTLEYVKKVTELSATTDVPEIPSGHHQILVYWTNMLVSAEQGDDAGFSKWERLSYRGLGRLNSRQQHRTGSSRRIKVATHLSITGVTRSRKDYDS